MQTIMYFVGYDQHFQKLAKTGWGCGYLMIPTNHPVVIHWQTMAARRKAEYDALTSEEQDEIYFYDDRYLSAMGGHQEITYTEPKTVNGIDYIVIGWDTAHSFNGPEHDFNYVFNETVEIKKIVDDFAS